MDGTWIICPVLNGVDYLEQALPDFLGQTVPTRVLIINNGGDDAQRAAIERWAEADPRVLAWHHDPPLPSLAATWNRALDFVWAVGGQEACVINHDVRLHRGTVETLARMREDTGALFVSAVGVRAAQFDPTATSDLIADTPRGGPDFSCFLISRTCHETYRFDEGFIPAYAEDLDTHRRMMLGGDGGRIFSINLPYLHYASRTINAMDVDARTRFAKRLEQSRRHYVQCWGGPVNQERFTRKGDPTSALEGVTTPELQRRVQGGRFAPDAVLRDVPCSATPDSSARCSGDSHLGGDIHSARGVEEGSSTAVTDRA